MTTQKSRSGDDPTRPRPGKQYPGIRGKIVDWAEHIFEEGMLYVTGKPETVDSWPST
jgi:hypothetical protein